MRTTQKSSKKLFAIITASVVAVLALGYFGYAYITKDAWPFTAEATDSNATSEDGINYNPPTDQEKQDSQDGKKNSASQDEANNPSSASTTKVSVGIAYAGYDDEEGMIDIRAFTTDVVEGTGTCTATLTKNGQTITRTSKAFVDSSSSQCEPILINPTDFPSGGTWSLTVSYKSDTSSGVSAPMQVEVTT